MTACPPGCTCRRHRERTAAENAEHGARIAAAAERRRHWPTEQMWAPKVHRRCLKCGTGNPWCESRRFA